MWRFLKRQLKTKTGKLALGVIAGTLADAITRNTLGVGIAEIPFAGAALDSIVGGEMASVMLGISFLRDTEAKKASGEA